MAAIALGTSVTPGSDASTTDGILGQTVVQGDVLYRNDSDRKLYKASTAGFSNSKVVGVALSGGNVNTKILYQYAGTVENTATLVVGEAFFIADTAGQVFAATDVLLSSGDFYCFLGFAITATKLKLSIAQSGVAHA